MPQIYFSFPDGVFDYVCAECDALCCRGQGFGGSLDREMTSLLAIYPSLHGLAVRRRGDVLHFATFRQGCQFLDDDRHCRIERDHGKALKPGVCTLFPFNAFSRIGDVLVVSPHFLCPLRMRVPPMPGAVAGTHRAIHTAVVDSALVEERTWQQTVRPRRLPDSAEAPAVLASEERFRDLCGSALGHTTFRSLLMTASSNPRLLSDLSDRAASCLGLGSLPPSACSDQIDDLLLAISPSFRLGLLHVAGESILLALDVGARLLREASQLGATPPTPQSAFNHLSAMTPILELLARTSPVQGLDDGQAKTPPFGNAHLTRAARRLLAGLWAGQSGLAAVEDAVADLPVRSDRMALLLEVGRTCCQASAGGGGAAFSASWTKQYSR